MVIWFRLPPLASPNTWLNIMDLITILTCILLLLVITKIYGVQNLIPIFQHALITFPRDPFRPQLVH